MIWDFISKGVRALDICQQFFLICIIVVALLFPDLSIINFRNLMQKMEVGIDSFAAMFSDRSSNSVSDADAMSQLLERIEHADRVGLDVFGIGEHHRKGFLDSAPTLILAAAAARTKRIRLSSAVTVLSAADPVRVFQNFATLDLISGGRAEMVAGRGSFIEEIG